MLSRLINIVTGKVSVTAAISAPISDEASEAFYAKSREATDLQRHGDTAAALEALDQAQKVKTDAGEQLADHDDIRRAKYLQKDGRGAEAWAIYLRLLAQSEGFAEASVIDAMRLHLQREGEGERAVKFVIASRLSKIALYRDMKAGAEAAIAGPPPDYIAELDTPELVEMLGSSWDTMKAVHRQTIDLADKWLDRLTDTDDVNGEMGKLAKKLKQPERTPALTHETLGAIASGVTAKTYLAAHLG